MVYISVLRLQLGSPGEVTETKLGVLGGVLGGSGGGQGGSGGRQRGSRGLNMEIEEVDKEVQEAPHLALLYKEAGPLDESIDPELDTHGVVINQSG